MLAEIVGCLYIRATPAQTPSRQNSSSQLTLNRSCADGKVYSCSQQGSEGRQVLWPKKVSSEASS